MRRIEGSTILITGADGGIGNAIIKECCKRNAGKIYAAGLSLEKVEKIASEYPGVVFPIAFDVTDDAQIKKTAMICSDTNILINNAGVELKSSFTDENAAQKAIFEMKVNYISLLSMINEFFPSLKANAPSSVINILSVGSTAIVKRLGTYCASKSAAHILTQAIRQDMKSAGIDIIGVYPGYVDTKMSEDVDFKKATPISIAENICNGFECGVFDIFPDEMSSTFFKKRPIQITYLK